MKEFFSGLFSNTSSNGLLSFSSYYYTAMSRSAPTLERQAPLIRLVDLFESVPADGSTIYSRIVKINNTHHLKISIFYSLSL